MTRGRIFELSESDEWSLKKLDFSFIRDESKIINTRETI